MPIHVDNPATINHQNVVGVRKHRQPMRDDDDGPSLGDPAQIAPDNHFALGIERAGRFIKDQNARIDDECSGNRKALLLPAR